MEEHEITNYDGRNVEILDAVEAWHFGAGDDMELYEYLGLTWEEYGRWAKDDVLPDGWTLPEHTKP